MAEEGAPDTRNGYVRRSEFNAFVEAFNDFHEETSKFMTSVGGVPGMSLGAIGEIRRDVTAILNMNQSRVDKRRVARRVLLGAAWTVVAGVMIGVLVVVVTTILHLSSQVPR